MTDEILYGLMEIFKLANNQYLKLPEIAHRMQDLGFYQNVESAEASIDLYVYYLKPPIFHESKNYKNKNWGRQWKVAHWLPRKENKSQDSTISLLPTEKATQRTTPPNKTGVILVHEQDITISLLQAGEEIQRTISPSGTELNNGTIQLYGQDFDRFFASMDAHQQRRVSIDVNYYASEHNTCRIEQDNNDRWLLRSEWLKKWYLENQVSPGDKIWLVIENVKPLAIRVYTEWERNPDTYRRHRYLQSGKPIQSVDIPIRDLIWDFLEKTQKCVYRLDIGKAILEKRPEISEQSIYACLSANPYLFARVGEGYWGLKEWGLDQVVRAIRPAESTLEEKPNLPTEVVPLDYILANIASENLVYRILEASPKALTAAEITERISKVLHVNKDVLARATFFDPSDPRYYRQEDGTFTLRKNLEEVIHKLSEERIEERKLKISLENEIHELNARTESLVGQQEKKVRETEEERDLLKKVAEEWIGRYEEHAIQWDKRTQLLSTFFEEITEQIGLDKLKEILNRLRNKPKL